MAGGGLLHVAAMGMPPPYNNRAGATLGYRCSTTQPSPLFASPQQRLRRCGAPCGTQRRSWRKRRMVTTATLNTNAASPNAGGGAPDPADKAGAAGLGSTRLGRLVSARKGELLQRWNTVRRNFPAKIFLLLFGFFFANALATVLGQTGDWDVLVAGILVAIIEGLGHLMYRMPAFLGERGKAVVEFVNYWKIGFVFALFVDAFKLWAPWLVVLIIALYWISWTSIGMSKSTEQATTLGKLELQRKEVAQE